MKLVGYKLRTVLIIMILAFVFITTLGILRIANNHNEAARWGDLNHSVYFGDTTVVICQGAIINYNPAIYGRLGGPFPHLLEIVPKVRDTLNWLLYFLKPCPVTPKQSQIQISVQILFRAETGKPDFEFTLDKIKNSSKYSLWGENVVFRDMWFTGVDWNKNDFSLSITDRYLDSDSRDSKLRQKLYFVRWQDSWRVLDVGPVQSLIRDKTEKTDLDLGVSNDS